MTEPDLGRLETVKRWLDSIRLRAMLAVLPYAPKWRNSSVTYTINRAGDQHLIVLHFINKHGNEVTMQATGSALVLVKVIVWMDDSWMEAPRG